MRLGSSPSIPREAAPGLLVDDSEEDVDHLEEEKTTPGLGFGEATRPFVDLGDLGAGGTDGGAEARSGRGGAPPSGTERQPVTAVDLAGLSVLRCSRCRAHISAQDDACRSCGYILPPGHPGSVTQRLHPPGRAPTSPAFPAPPAATVAPAVPASSMAEVRVIYSSDSLSIDGVARDIGRAGLFLATELLDPVGTPCQVIALPEGYAAVRLFGEVQAVVAGAGPSGRAAGMRIRLTGVSPDAQRWLDSVVGRGSGRIL